MVKDNNEFYINFGSTAFFKNTISPKEWLNNVDTVYNHITESDKNTQEWEFLVRLVKYLNRKDFEMSNNKYYTTNLNSGIYYNNIWLMEVKFFNKQGKGFRNKIKILTQKKSGQSTLQHNYIINRLFSENNIKVSTNGEYQLYIKKEYFDGIELIQEILDQYLEHVE